MKRISDLRQNSLLGDIAVSLGFLSRLPLPNRWFGQSNDSPVNAIRAFPLAGAILGLLAGLLLAIAALLHLPPLACAFIAVGALAAFTGALHEDGLGDSADGFFGAHDRDRRLEIMKDSRIGTFAAMTLIVATGLKASLIAALLERTDILSAVLALIGAEAFSRAMMLALWYGLPSARPGGLADRSGRPEWDRLVTALVVGLAILTLTALAIAGFPALFSSLLLSMLVVYGFARLCLAKIGGQTGDTIGASQQIAALACLAGFVMVV